jgi:hypothetical protein
MIKKNRHNRLFDATNSWKYFCNLAKKYGKLQSKAQIIFLIYYK